MKKLLLLLASLSLLSCGSEKKENNGTETTATITPEETGKAIFEGKGNCYSCHRADEQSIGPAIKDISKIYKDKKGNIVSFLKEESKPIVDPDKYSLMKANFYITKTFTDDELKAVEAYIYSH
ncbi:c-type cytochrome [Flavobacterium sp. RHBU_24]|uniref:c-type cytochrome n=1 Tax=Flavobacterium sp. RHBU_24 TaxID=3391185 RepID=UPI003985346C